ncbi:iron ABC transporter permease, partial [Nocardioides sp.]
MTTEAIARIRRRQRVRATTVVAVGAGLSVGLLVLTMSLGVAGVPPARALPAIVGIGERLDLLVVQQLRLPRGLAAILAGAAFGLAGALFQSTLRNNLASPDILGISQGASLGAITAVIGFGAAGVAVSLAALGGGLTVALAIWALAWRNGLHGLRFVLVGVGLSYLCGSLVAWWLSEADIREAGSALLWTVGSVADVRDGSLDVLASGVAALGLLAVAVSGEQRPLALGDEHAHGL